MNEQQKAAAGYLYDANYDADLVAQRNACKDLCFAFNQTLPSDTAAQKKLLTTLLGTVGEQACITAPFYCDYGKNIHLGERFYANHNCVLLDAAPITFGEDVFLAPGCCFTTAGHPLDREQRDQGLEFAAPIVVGDGVWFGANVTVLPGVTIGEGSVIGAGSVINRDIPPYVVAVGAPCRVLRKITPEDKDKYPRYSE